jgi:hypothetical protein
MNNKLIILIYPIRYNNYDPRDGVHLAHQQPVSFLCQLRILMMMMMMMVVELTDECGSAEYETYTKPKYL